MCWSNYWTFGRKIMLKCLWLLIKRIIYRSDVYMRDAIRGIVPNVEYFMTTCISSSLSVFQNIGERGKMARLARPKSLYLAGRKRVICENGSCIVVIHFIVYVLMQLNCMAIDWNGHIKLFIGHTLSVLCHSAKVVFSMFISWTWKVEMHISRTGWM